MEDFSREHYHGKEAGRITGRAGVANLERVGVVGHQGNCHAGESIRAVSSLSHTPPRYDGSWRMGGRCARSCMASLVSWIESEFRLRYSPALTRFSKQVPPTIAQSAGAFFGVQYQAMGGSLDRDDLSARVGGERKLGATDGGSYALKHSRHVL